MKYIITIKLYFWYSKLKIQFTYLCLYIFGFGEGLVHSFWTGKTENIHAHIFTYIYIYDIYTIIYLYNYSFMCYFTENVTEYVKYLLSSRWTKTIHLLFLL